MGKKRSLCCVWTEIMIAFSPRNIQWSTLFAQKAQVNTERVPPGHPMILFKSNKFNMAAASSKRSVLVELIVSSLSFAVRGWVERNKKKEFWGQCEGHWTKIEHFSLLIASHAIIFLSWSYSFQLLISSRSLCKGQWYFMIKILGTFLNFVNNNYVSKALRKWNWELPQRKSFTVYNFHAFLTMRSK